MESLIRLLFPFPWRVANFDGRIVIVAANEAKVTELQPGQHAGQVVSRETARALGQYIVDQCNAASMQQAIEVTEGGA